ncbi:MAG: hypothetical protein JSV78_01895 [Phycisphaerales bacterium]|nr:MAG: hypothetical protein JSV78_01895 [Phycisphaerales bacterium]
MARRNRTSVLKREREKKKRQREMRKAEKAALKRQRREQHITSEPEVVSLDDLHDQEVKAGQTNEEQESSSP